MSDPISDFFGRTSVAVGVPVGYGVPTAVAVQGPRLQNGVQTPLQSRVPLPPPAPPPDTPAGDYRWNAYYMNQALYNNYREQERRGTFYPGSVVWVA
jgi:hypothetical protein